MKNILIIRFSSLGDLVTLEPTFRTISEFFRNCNIIFLTSGIGKGLYEDTGYFEKIIVHRNFLQTLKILRKYEFQIVYNLQCTRPSHYITTFLIKEIQINSSRNLYQKMFNIKVKSKKLNELIQLSNMFTDNEILNYFDNFDSDIILKSKLEKNYIKKENQKKIIAISTGTSERWLSKKWGINNYIDLIDDLINQNYQIILVGSKLELEDESLIFERFGNKALSFIDKTSLTELKKVLSEVDVFIGNDSGPAHIAAALGTDTITIFGSTDKKHSPAFLPYKGVHKYLIPKDEIKCHPCYKTKCPTNMECMASISVSNVLEKVKQIFKEQK